MPDAIVYTGKEDSHQRYARLQREADEREAKMAPLADQLAQREHARRHLHGDAYYRWEQMQPEYRRGKRATMLFVVELLGEPAVAAALEDK